MTCPQWAATVQHLSDPQNRQFVKGAHGPGRRPLATSALVAHGRCERARASDADPAEQRQTGEDRDRRHDEKASVQAGEVLPAVIRVACRYGGLGACWFQVPARRVMLQSSDRRVVTVVAASERERDGMHRDDATQQGHQKEKARNDGQRRNSTPVSHGVIIASGGCTKMAIQSA